jgi:uncharacterized membrane protein
MDKLKQSLVKKFMNADGTINKTVVASLITLLIVLVQQIMVACGFSYGHWDQVVAIINTVLTLLGLCGFVEGNGQVEIPITKLDSSSDSLGQKPTENVQKGSDNSNESQKN